MTEVALPIGERLAKLRRVRPELTGSLRIDGKDGSFRFAVRNQDPPEQLVAAYQALHTASISSPGAYGWYADQQKWVRL
jgi:hypothetical protein